MPMASSPSLLVSAPLSLPLPRARQRPFVFSPSRTKPDPTRPASFPFHSRTFPRVPSPSPHLPLKLLCSRESKVFCGWWSQSQGKQSDIIFACDTAKLQLQKNRGRSQF
ncbi:uncharacterized protein LOC126705911 isoform X2 [Quercus robur]|uniref:uncharacterized protein LOC126705911 isoform X2 n=1 Tax=Quercus robur TaxID=38942 RepID=UPI002163993D|nr:uncharacterized protein LOC126705911 isoform X2 [Quercus robur]